MHFAVEFSEACWRTLYDRISYETVLEWKQFFSKNPFKSHRSDIQTGIIASTAWNASALSTGVKAMSVSDFMLNPITTTTPVKESESMSDDEMEKLILTS